MQAVIYCLHTLSWLCRSLFSSGKALDHKTSQDIIAFPCNNWENTCKDFIQDLWHHGLGWCQDGYWSFLLIDWLIDKKKKQWMASDSKVSNLIYYPCFLLQKNFHDAVCENTFQPQSGNRRWRFLCYYVLPSFSPK